MREESLATRPFRSLVSWLSEALPRSRRQARAEARQVQEALAQLATERARLLAIVESIPAAIVVAEAPSGRVVLGNAQAEQALGHPLIPTTEIEGYRQWRGRDLKGRRLEPEDYPLVRALRGETGGQEFLYDQDDGSQKRLQASWVPIRNPDGEIAGSVVLFSDVSRERQAQEERKTLEESLRRQTEALQEADRNKNEFLMMLAHELRNPLAPIQNALQILALRGGRPGRGRAGARADGAAGPADGPPGGRPAGDLADQPGQDQSPEGAARPGRGHRRRRRDQPAADRGPPPRADGHAVRRARPDRGRSRPAGAGDGQPAEQRRQVHRDGRPHPPDGRAGGRAGGPARPRHRRRHPARDAPEDLRPVHPDRGHAGPFPGGSRHRPAPGPPARRDAWRHDRGTQRRDRPGQRIRGPAARAGRGKPGPAAMPAAFGRRRGIPAHPGRGRQRGRGGKPGPVAAALWARGPARP